MLREGDSMTEIDPIVKLATEVLSWWEEHQYDTDTDGCGEEWNVYDKEPTFVTLAKKIVK